jgi:hypothetical protein
MAAAVQVGEEELVREKIAETALPKGVRFKQSKKASDWTGDPSFEIYFAVSKKIPLTKRHLTELNRVDSDLTDRIFELKLDRWPFVIFEEEK